MPINSVNIKKAVKLVGARHTRAIIRMAEDQDDVENYWMQGVALFHRDLTEDILNQLKRSGRIIIPDKVFQKFLIEHYVAVCENAIESTEFEMQHVAPVKLAKPKIPQSLRELRQIWDKYNRTGKLPQGFKDRSKEIKDQYLKKTKSVWRKYSDDFRVGDEFTQDNVLRKVQQAVDTVESRARTIVRTETTNYYNDTRRDIYDGSDAIWGYLLMAIRDQGTTKWCTDKITNGKRGRHGLVYKKGDPLTDKETPSCHWNCRSEFTPLTIYNPRHRKLIEDLSLRRRNHVCHPLPKGWN